MPTPVVDYERSNGIEVFTRQGEGLDILDYRQELERCRARLAAEMDLQDVPDEVWGYLMKLDLASDVIFGGDDEWRELLKTARDRRRESLEERGIVIPSGREEGEGARSVRYEEIALEPSEGAMKRAEAYSEVAANMAHAHPDVRRFRRDYLLTDVRQFRRILCMPRCSPTTRRERSTKSGADLSASIL